MQYNVVFQPSGRRGVIHSSKTLLEASRELGVDIEAPCGGAEICGKCKVKIEVGSHLTSVTEKEKKMLTPEELAENYRLACCAKIQGNVVVFVPKESRGSEQVILENGRTPAFNLNPAIKKYYIELNKPTLEDFRDDFTRVKEELQSKFAQVDKEISIDYCALLALPTILRKGGWKVTVTLWNNREIILIEPGEITKAYGIAVDIGTTTIAAYLCDLITGKVLTQSSSMNSQVRYGDDVLSRITYCMMNDEGLARLHQLIIKDINHLIMRMTQDAGIVTDAVLEMVLVFNPTMHHIVLHIDPQYMGSAPFTSVIRKALNIKARELAITIARSGYIHCLPIEAGFVGADNVSVLIAEEPYKQDKMALIIDIGTNGEINFGNKDGMLSASCATGPALEGAQIKHGMRAAPGAIERVKIDPDTMEPEIKVIGETSYSNIPQKNIAKGICGSGIIDAVAELFKASIIGTDGSFNKKIDVPRLRQAVDGKTEYVLVWARDTAIDQDITITQKDIRAVQMAKAALYAGAKILMKKRGVDKVDTVILAGAFGSYIDKENALVIGLFPNCDLQYVVSVGNAAGEGAKLALLDINKRLESQEIADFMQFVETANEGDFQTHYLDAMYFPHAKDAFSHVEHILEKIPNAKK